MTAYLQLYTSLLQDLFSGVTMTKTWVAVNYVLCCGAGLTAALGNVRMPGFLRDNPVALTNVKRSY